MEAEVTAVEALVEEAAIVAAVVALVVGERQDHGNENRYNTNHHSAETG